MTSRAELMQQLLKLPTSVILQCLEDKTMLDIASRYFTSTCQSDQPSISPGFSPTPVGSHLKSKVKTSGKAKPASVNAFMAFRSYYANLWPEQQQKISSGCLTSLWNKDPCRNKWVLIAKVYTFVRQQVGDKISLGYFLQYACPVMGIVEPQAYLSVMGWSIEQPSQRLIQDEAVANIVQSQLAAFECPSTELELLSALVNLGYLPEQGVDLIDKLSTNSIGIMTTRNPRLTLPVSYTPEKLNFMSKIKSDPVQATRDLLGDTYCDLTFQSISVASYDVENLDSINHLPMQIELLDPRYYYNYSSSYPQFDMNTAPTMMLDHISEHESFDIDNPWDVDVMLGQSQSGGQRIIREVPSMTPMRISTTRLNSCLKIGWAAAKQIELHGLKNMD
ncbi:hypothetical protein E4U48_000890 [Claviceps purpurea]|nr:hypothetical protein E4U10_006728 [Claviceps purpurea]KAG6283324.1 hypothetical protein E4U48_000890 [Claviceps purpurea]KAG6307803.1 hypothetical protein E4U45_003479 [Claviceps purpurea]